MSATQDAVRAQFQQAAQHAQQHARCGRKAHCRVNALANVDAILDDGLALGVQHVQDAPPSPLPG